MKKGISAVLCFLLTVITMSPVLAQTQEEAMLVAIKDRIGSTQGYETFNSSVQETEQGKSFVFEWQGEEKFFTVTVNQEGMITQYRKSDWGTESNTSLHFDRPSISQVMKNAEQLVSRLNPDLEFVLEPNAEVMDLYSDRIQFTLQRTHQGLPVIGDEGYVSVDVTGDTLWSFSIKYTQGLTFESENAAIDQEQARQLYKQKLSPKLYYIEEGDEEDRCYLPVYRLQDDLKYISGMDGSLVEMELDKEVSPANLESDSSLAETDQAAGLTPEELAHLDEIEGLLSKEQLENSLRNNPLLSLDSALPLKSFERQMSLEGEYLSALHFMGDDWNQGVDATVNAQTGELLYFNDHAFWSGQEEITHNEDAERKVFNELSQRAEEFRYDTELNRFVRYQNEIPFESDFATVTLNEQEKVVSYNIHYGKSPVQSAQNVISAEQAAEKMFEQREYTLHFLPLDGTGKLVYAIEDKPRRIDAFTGEVGNDWTAASQERAVYTDLDGHYAKEYIETLASFGIGFESGPFYPDQTITTGEFTNLLYSTFVGTMTEEDEAKQWMLRTGGIPDDVDWNNALDRSTVASMLVYAMGYGEVAQLQDIYQTPFSDVTEEKGAIAILSAMEIVSGNGNGLFYPDQSMTRAEAMVLLYRYLSQK